MKDGAAMKKDNAVLRMRNIHKSFPGVKALQGVDFTLREGEVHALMGENGAGKSTLIKVLTGVYTKDEGDIFLEGNEGAVSIRSPQEAQRLGISTVYQEITLCPNLSVAENMYIGRTRGPVQNWKKDECRYRQNFAVTGYTGKGIAAAGKLFDCCAADGGHCQSGGYGLQSVDIRRTYFFPG